LLGVLRLRQSLVDQKGLNVKVLPVVGSEPLGSGYLKHPVGKMYCNGEADCKTNPRSACQAFAKRAGRGAICPQPNTS
jgi:hypothetical protein